MEVDGPKLRQTRLAALMTLEEAARLSGLTRETIRRMETNGRGWPSSLKVVARTYGKDPHAFVPEPELLEKERETA